MQGKKKGSRRIRCAYSGCKNWFELSEENAFQLYCDEHDTRAKREAADREKEQQNKDKK